MSTHPVKIDAYSHIAPTRYKKALEKISPKAAAYMIDPFPPLHDLESRFRIMDRYEGLVQVLTPAWPAVEAIADGRMRNVLPDYAVPAATLHAVYPETRWISLRDHKSTLIRLRIFDCSGGNLAP